MENLRLSDQFASEIPSDVLKDELSAQSNCDPGPVNNPTWPKCSLAVDELKRPFELAEVKKALEYCELAPGPDG